MRGTRPAVYLHVGAPKTGTTYIQNILWNNRGALENDGLLYPGSDRADHANAAFDLRQAGFMGPRAAGIPGAWRRIVDEARAWNGTAVISHELFSPATAKQAAKAVDALDFADVHVVYTARDLARQIPAVWQEDIKNRHILSFNEFLDDLCAPDHVAHGRQVNRFWRMQDAGNVLARWASSLPPERVHIVTVPQQGAPNGTLWRRFAGLVGIDPERYAVPAAGENRSLGATETTLLRRLNVVLDDDLEWPAYNYFVKQYLAKQILSSSEKPAQIALPPGVHHWAGKRSRAIVESLRKAGYDVVGDLEELVPPPTSPTGACTCPDDVQAEAQLDVAVTALAALVPKAAGGRAREVRLRAELERTEQARQRLVGRVVAFEQDLAVRRRHPVRTLVRDLSDRHRLVKRARVAWWHLAERSRRDR